jgi:diguanylate cyclase
MAKDENDRVIVHAVIDLGHNLGLQVVAEGVEDEETWNLLATMGCDLVQGYYVSRPMPAEECTSWLNERQGQQSVKIP